MGDGKVKFRRLGRSVYRVWGHSQKHGKHLKIAVRFSSTSNVYSLSKKNVPFSMYPSPALSEKRSPPLAASTTAMPGCSEFPCESVICSQEPTSSKAPSAGSSLMPHSEVSSFSSRIDDSSGSSALDACEKSLGSSFIGD